MNKSPDYLVSFCLAQEGALDAELDALSALAAFCAQRLQYWEIIYVIGECHRSSIQAATEKFAAMQSLRIVVVRDAISYYRRRMIGASEAIGDIVVLTSFAEMAKPHLLAFAEEAMARNRIVIGRKPGRSLFPTLSHSLVDLISRYRVDDRDLKTLVLPRNHLVAILDRSTAPIDLRFERKNGAAPYLRKELPLAGKGSGVSLTQRLELTAEIISNSASRFLSIFAMASMIVFVIAASYGVYAVAVILLQKNVQAGWFTTALAQSGTAAFFSLGFAIIALGIASIIDRMEGGARHDIVEEIGNISFYDRIHDLNVELTPDLQKVDANEPGACR
jgi:hypothetical protein